MKKIIRSGKSILNALAFAEVGNFSKFEELLDEMDQPISASTPTNASPRQHTENKPSNAALMSPIHCAM